MAPEQFNGSRVDEKCDVYALGCILNEAWSRRQPWRDSQHFFQASSAHQLAGHTRIARPPPPPAGLE